MFLVESPVSVNGVSAVFHAIHHCKVVGTLIFISHDICLTYSLACQIILMCGWSVKVSHTEGWPTLGDALSRVGPLTPEPQDCNSSLNNIEWIPVHLTTQITPASPERLHEICEATAKDSTLRLLAQIVHEGWPKQSKTVPTVHNHTGISEMKSHVKMAFRTKELD